ncbi:MAG TPA: MATE family efflux transporter [Stellaceae bacterium]|nr:MATE family efflux transporter [Stellaceae bacterium]
MRHVTVGALDRGRDRIATIKQETQMRPVKPADRRPRGGGGSELHATLALAAPLAAANLAQIAMGVTDTVMVGHLGAVPLAATGLGGMLYFTGGVMLQGILSAVAPLAAHALGAGDRRMVGRTAGAGLVLALIFALPFVAALTRLDRLLQMLGYNAALAAEIGHYLRAIAWGAPAFLGFEVLRSLFAVLLHTRSVMVVLLVCVANNVMLDWVMIFGHFGAPALGVAGAGYASAINQWLIVAGLFLCLRIMPGLGGLRLVRNACTAGRAEIAEILRLGLPIGGIRGLEAGVFMTAGVLMGLLGAAALGAHQLVINCASVTFMVPLGLGQAATVRVAHELGAGRAEAARRAGFIALALGIGFMSATAIVLWTFPQAIIAVYVDSADPANRDVVEIARQLLAIAALFQVFDGMQVIAAGALRGYKDTLVPMVLATFGYWGAGFAGGWLLAFPLGYGAAGLWWGLALGLAVVAALLTLRLYRLALPLRPGAAAVAAG